MNTRPAAYSMAWLAFCMSCAAPGAHGGGQKGGANAAPQAPSTPPVEFAPRINAPVVRATHLASGGLGFCALLHDGGVSCWGHERGNKPQRLEGIDDAIALSMEGAEVSLVRKDGTLTIVGGRSPAFEGVKDIVATAGGANNRCVIRRGGRVYCASKEQNHARAVRLQEAATRVEVGYEESCALTAAGKVWCWNNDTLRPEPVAALDSVVQLSVGSELGCARQSDRSVHCFALDEPHQLPFPAGSADSIHVRDLVENSGGYMLVLCSIQGQQAECRHGNFMPRALYRDAKLELPYSWFATSADARLRNIQGRMMTNMCMLDEHGEVHCAGSNDYGGLARPRPGTVDSPRHVAGVPPMRSFGISGGFVFALSRVGDVWAWNRYGPAKITEFGKAARMIVTPEYVCAFARGGAATCGHTAGGHWKNTRRAAALDNAKELFLPQHGLSIVAAISQDGGLMVGRLAAGASFDTLNLKKVDGLQDLQRVSADFLTTTFNSHERRYQVTTLDSRGRVRSLVLSFDQRSPAKEMQLTAPKIQGQLNARPETNRVFLMDPDGSIQQRHIPHARAVRAGGAFYFPLPDSGKRCAFTGTGDVLCLNDAAFAPRRRAKYSVLFTDIVAAEVYRGLYYALDKEGTLHCLGTNTQGLCGAEGMGFARSDTPLRVPLH